MKIENREALVELADSIHCRLPIYRSQVRNSAGQYVPNPEPRPELTEFYEEGMLRKEQLEHGKYYLGACRNASVARWHSQEQKFYYQRHKFGEAYEEDIEHPSDDNGHDVFVPLKEVVPADDEEVCDAFITS